MSQKNTRKSEKESRRLEQRYHICSKQYTERGMKLRFISETQPELPCTRPELGLEDAYMYLMSR